MAWTWKGFWGDDPVYRFNCGNNFWHAGRSKAEERFWVDHVHGDGSYKTPLRLTLNAKYTQNIFSQCEYLRSRLSSRASSVATTASSRPRTRNISTQSESSLSSMTTRSRNSSSGSITDQVFKLDCEMKASSHDHQPISKTS